MENVFNHFYQDYDAWYTTAMGSFVDALESEALFDLLPVTPQMKILDVGCGTGNYSLKMAKMGAQVTGIDIAPNMLAQAKEKAGADTGASPVTFAQMEASALAYADNSFDAAISMAAFEFMPDVQRTFQEMLRVVRPGGIIAIGTIQKGGDWYKLYTSPACADTAYAYAHFLTEADLKSLDPAHYRASRQCLYVAPGLAGEAYTKEQETRYKESGKKGGFVCVSFQK